MAEALVCEDDNDETPFLGGISMEERNACYSRFYEATSTAALASSVCGVCARERFNVVDRVEEIPLGAIPNAERLVQPRGVRIVEEVVYVRVCGTCLTELRQKEHRPPRHSLANKLWIGDIPWVLKTLTFPEQLLIALAYPRVFVFKPLDLQGIASMVDGNLMPRSPAILASLIAISFIGARELTKNWIYSMFRVRRRAVWRALLWQKTTFQRR